jgi:hypothetical protein
MEQFLAGLGSLPPWVLIGFGIVCGVIFAGGLIFGCWITDPCRGGGL